MTASREENVLAILSIPNALSSNSNGISLLDAIRETRYVQIRDSLDAEMLAEALRSDRSAVERWIQLSEDKRTSGGWYVLRESREIGQLSDACSTRTFKTIEDAVANFILNELDSASSHDAA